MGQIEIALKLSENYPRYLSSQEIAQYTGIGHRSVMRTLYSMRKRNEVEYKIVWGKTLNSGWQRKYRMRGGNYE